MRLVVTRPAEDAQPLAERLEAMGHRVLVEPMLTIVADPDAPLPPGPWRAILVTSANAVRALDGRPDRAGLLTIPVFAVGSASARAARAAGFASVTSAEGDLASLVALVRRMTAPDDGRLLYLAGRQISGDPAARLAGDGYVVVRAVVYEAVPASGPSARLAEALAAGEVDGVLLFSPRTARIWRAVAGPCAGGREIVHFCLSQAVADALTESGGPAVPVRVAEHPDTDSLLRLLDR